MSLFCPLLRGVSGRFGVFPLGVRLSGVAVLVRVAGVLVRSRGASTGNQERYYG